MKNIEVTLAFQNVIFFPMPKGILMAVLIILLSIAGKHLFYFQLNCCYMGGGQWGNKFPKSGPELLHLVVLGSQFILLLR